MPVTTVLLAAADTTAIDSAVTDMVSTVQAVITSALPIVLPICGIIVAAVLDYVNAVWKQIEKCQY
ncbi:MAG: hypothetical protein LUC25_07600 [Ruminococcus sp.]|nr:hypothetical protein [Ruminococcus sp.]